ncbi:MAG: PIN domain-containing protein [Nitrospirae bacterium]|nr:PIN domain-containing protein [Nitrospirota bacterium]
MNGKVLIDTSVWIDFFRGKNTELIERVTMLLKLGKAVYTGIIALELINGAKDRKELQTLSDVFGTMERIEEVESTHFNAGMLGYGLARKGHTLGVVDLLIAQIAIENAVALMTSDEHFKVMAKHSGLQLFQQ